MNGAFVLGLVASYFLFVAILGFLKIYAVGGLEEIERMKIESKMKSGVKMFFLFVFGALVSFWLL